MLPRAVLWGFVVAVIAIVAIGFLSYRSQQERADGVDRMNHTIEVRYRLDGLLSTVLEAETGQRGYLLTGDTSYLEPYQLAIARLASDLEQVKELTHDNATQQQKISALMQLIDEKRRELTQTIGLQRAGKGDDALAVVREGRGKRTMDLVRITLREMKDEEQRLLDARTAAWERSVTFSTLVTMGGSFLLFLLVLGAASITSRDFRLRNAQVWLRGGQNTLAGRIAGEQPLEELSRNVLQFLGHYLQAHVGSMYIAGADGALTRAATYAMSRETHDGPLTFRPGEGLVGQAAAENRLLHLPNVPHDYLPITSSLGQHAPLEIVVVPLHAGLSANAVLELGFFRPLVPFDKELLALIAEPVGIAVRSVQYRMRLESLLEETQRQSEELQAQQEELRVANSELEEQGQALREYQSKLESQQAELEQTNSLLEEQMQMLESQRDELSRAQEELTARAGALEQASRYKSEFLANMSHELRTPLNSSLILAKLLADNKHKNLSDEQVTFARSIYSAGNDLLSMINDILDLSKIEAGKLEVRSEPVTLSRLVESLTQTFQPLARQKGVELNTTIDRGCPLRIDTDGQRLTQILTNLLSNATKFTDKGAVSLRIFAPDDDRVAFAVSDTGIGIAADQHELIFEAFQQADGTTSRKYGGTGLGLSISRDLARLLGGQIDLASAPGAGSTFTLILPRIYVEQPSPTPVLKDTVRDVVARTLEAQPAMQQRRATAHAFDDRARLTGSERVLLVVEDDPTFAKILYDLAHELKFSCLIAGTADEGMDLALQYQPVAIVLDMKLPDHSGLSLLDRLKHNSNTRHIPVQVVSISDYTQTALAMGAVGYMLKPVKREELVTALTELDLRFTEGVRSVLVVEDNELQRESICQLLGSHDVRTVPVATVSAALEHLRSATVDCMVLDLALPDASGYQLLEKMAQEEEYSFPPVIVYTGRSISSDEEQRLRKYSTSIIIKGAKSPERLLDEVTLFLHQVEAKMPADRRRMLQEARDREAIFDGKHILLVEDDVRNIFALSHVLEPRGAKVEIARNGKEALEVLKRVPKIDIVLMDIMMPEMDGYEAMRHIRKDATLADVAIIALTAKAMPDDQQRCLEAGANDYIAKPIDVEKLLSLIRIWLPN